MAHPGPRASRPPAPHHHLHLLNLARLLHWKAQQFVSCYLHEERVENPNLPGVDVPDEGRLLPEALSHLRGTGLEGRDEGVRRPVSQVQPGGP